MLVTSLFWTIKGQMDMKESWRIGIDTKDKTKFITGGIFLISRNPIFVGILGSLIGLFLINPNLVTVSILIIASIFIQIQILLEEDFLLGEHGEAYKKYKNKTHRFVGFSKK